MRGSAVLALVLLALFAVSAHSLNLLSDDLHDGAHLSRSLTCDSEAALSPELHWENAPANTEAFTLVFYDEDFTHWMVNLPKDVTSLPRGASLAVPSSVLVKSPFVAPCPPSGEKHAYVFEVFALAQHEELPEETAAALQILRSRALASDTLTGYYGESFTVARGLRDIAATINVPLTSLTIPEQNITAINDSVILTTLVQTLNATVPFTRVTATVALTILSQNGCFTLGFVGKNGTSSICGSAADVNKPSLRFEAVFSGVTGFQAVITAKPNSGSGLRFSGTVSFVYTAETITDRVSAPLGTTFTPTEFTATSKRLFDVPYPAVIPDVPAGKVLKQALSVQVDAGASADTFTLCVLGGFGPYVEDLTKATCIKLGSSAIIPFSTVYTRATTPQQPWFLIFAKAAGTKRGTQAATAAVTVNQQLTVENAGPNNTVACENWTIINLSFADMILK